MAGSTIYGTTSNQYIQSAIIWSATADEKNNKSYVTATLYYKRTNEFTTSGTGTFSISIEGVATKKTKSITIANSWVEVVSAGQWVDHNKDGSKSITISASGNIPDTTLTSTDCSDTVTLDKISRATTIDSLTCDTSYLDGLIAYKYTPQSSYYTRANISLNLNGTYLQIRSNNHGKQTAGTQQGQDVRFVEQELSTIYEALPKTTTAKIRVTIRTYSDSSYSNQVGEASHKEISLTIPTSVKPKDVSLNVSRVNKNTWINGKKIYVAGYSGLSATLSGEAGEGASISSRSITGGGYSSTASTLSVDKISASGSITLSGKVTDSRGRSDTASAKITVHPYSAPAITSLTITRGTYDSDWTADENGPDVKVVFKTSLALTDYSNKYKASFSLNGVAKTPDSGATADLTSGTAYTVYFRSIDGESSHSLKVSATDSVCDTGTATITIPTINVTMEFNSSGKGIAFGKTSEKEAFECAWDAEFSGKVIIGGKQIVFKEDGTCTWTSV